MKSILKIAAVLLVILLSPSPSAAQVIRPVWDDINSNLKGLEKHLAAYEEARAQAWESFVVLRQIKGLSSSKTDVVEMARRYFNAKRQTAKGMRKDLIRNNNEVSRWVSENVSPCVNNERKEITAECWSEMSREERRGKLDDAYDRLDRIHAAIRQANVEEKKRDEEIHRVIPEPDDVASPPSHPPATGTSTGQQQTCRNDAQSRKPRENTLWACTFYNPRASV